MVKLKFCGLSRREDILAVNELLPDYIGFVFAPSKRQIMPDRAKELKRLLRPEIKSVGVFVNAKAEFITELCQDKVIDLVQLHGNETEEYIARLKKAVTQPVIKAVRVQSTADITAASQSAADYLLLDTYRKGQYGGVGETFDWGLIPAITKPFFLAGGLKEENIRQALTACRPFALDLSSGIETAGVKDKEKMKNILEIMRRI